MIPVIFHIGPIPINSFGLMMVCAFVSGWLLLWQTLSREGEDPAIAEPMVFWAAIGGLVGARLDYILSFPTEFLARPWEMIFSGAGFVFYGGLIGGVVAVAILLRRHKKSFWRYADLTAPTLALGYAVGRVGCHLSGDGDYGSETMLPWGVSYSLGVVPTPPGVLVHPTPVYETLGGLLLTWLLLTLLRRRTLLRAGQLFAVYLSLSAVLRFLVEFARIEPVVFAALTQAQLVSIVLVLASGVIFRRPLASR